MSRGRSKEVVQSCPTVGRYLRRCDQRRHGTMRQFPSFRMKRFDILDIWGPVTAVAKMAAAGTAAWSAWPGTQQRS